MRMELLKKSLALLILVSAASACGSSSESPRQGLLISRGGSAAVDVSASGVGASLLTNIPADGQSVSLMTVILRDSSNAVIPGQALSFRSSPSGLRVSPMTGVTNGLGEFQVSLSSTVVGLFSVSVIVNEGTPDERQLDQRVDLQFIDPTIPDAQMSTVIASPATGLLANGTDLSNILVTVRNSTGAAQGGLNVILNVTGSQNTLSPAMGTTNAAGEFRATLSSSMAESKTLTAVIMHSTGDVTVGAQPSILFSTMTTPMTCTGNKITGTAGNDFLVGTTGADCIEGLAGDDSLTSSMGGADQIFGGLGDDQFAFDSAQVVLLDGGAGRDTTTVFQDLNLSDPAIQVKFKNMEDFSTDVVLTLTLNAGDVAAVGGEEITFNGVTGRAIFIHVAPMSGGAGATVVGSGWTNVSASSSQTRPNGTFNFEVYQNTALTPAVFLFVDTQIQNRTINP